jgi:flavin-binding protein dodecin
MPQQVSPRSGATLRAGPFTQEEPMNAYKVIEIIGSSSTSWEDAAKNAILEAAKSIRHLRVGEVNRLDVNLSDDGQVLEYRARLKVSMKHEAE